MSEKNRDAKGRWRSVTIAFRVTPEENELLNKKVSLSGITKQEYLTSNMLKHEIKVVGNPRVFKALRNEMELICEELKRLGDASKVSEEFLEVTKMACEIYEGMVK